MRRKPEHASIAFLESLSEAFYFGIIYLVLRWEHFGSKTEMPLGLIFVTFF